MTWGVKAAFFFLFGLVSVACTSEIYFCLWLLFAVSGLAISYPLSDVIGSQVFPFCSAMGLLQDFISSWESTTSLED